MARQVAGDDLPEGREWAEAPLLDPANVGRYVWYSWNGNRPSLVEITSIGRTNIYSDRMSFKPDPDDPGMASGRSGGYGIAIYTNQYRLERRARMEAAREVDRRIRNLRWHHLSMDQLAIISRALDEMGVV